MAETTRLQDIFLHLKNNGFEVYFIGQHVGDCTNNYVVVKKGVSSPYQNFSTNIDYYEILCYTPKKSQVTEAERFCKRVERAMLALSPMIKTTNNISAPYFDDDVKGYMVSMTYRNFRKVDGAEYLK